MRDQNERDNSVDGTLQYLFIIHTPLFLKTGVKIILKHTEYSKPHGRLSPDSEP